MLVQLTTTPTFDYVQSQHGHAAFLDLKVPDAPSSAFTGFMSATDLVLGPPDLREGDFISIEGEIDHKRKIFLIIDHHVPHRDDLI